MIRSASAAPRSADEQSSSATALLVFCTCEPSEAAQRSLAAIAQDNSAYYVHAAADAADWPANYHRLSAADLLEMDELRRAYLDFLEDWPRRPLVKGLSFDDLFRHVDGYSVWWTGEAPGGSRSPDKGVFPLLRTLWLFDRAVTRVAPRRVIVHADRTDLAWTLAERCRREGIACEFLPGSTLPGGDPFAGRMRWVIAAIVWSVYAILRIFLRAICARIAVRKPQPRSAQPVIVYATPVSGNTRVANGQLDPFWRREVSAAVAQLAPDVRHCDLLHFTTPLPGYRNVAGVWHQGWKLLAGLHDALPPVARYIAPGSLARGFVAQLAGLWRYARVERTDAYRRSFQFAGCDAAAIVAPLLRRAVARTLTWAHAVAATERSLRAAGKVKALVVGDEFYPSATADIAAARRLRIPVVGFQHGTIFPQHFVYTPPPGYVARAPAPDYFAAYGEYARDVLSVHGAFPAERVWLTGGVKFDALLDHPLDAVAAKSRLGLPPDRKVLLIATQVFPWFPAAVRAALRAAAPRDDCVVCLKTHPINDRLEAYRQLAAEIGAKDVRFFDDRFAELLAACDVLMSGSSTAVLEAIVAGKRTICANFSQEPDRFPYHDEGGSLAARNDVEMADALDQALRGGDVMEFDARREQFLRRHVRPRGHTSAAAAVAERIVQLGHGDGGECGE